MKVLNFGSLNMDYVYQVEHMVTPGETLDCNGMNIFCGGKGLNQSIALKRAGVDVFHAGLIGEDGEPLLELCRKNNIHTDYIKKVEGKNGHAIIQVDKSGQNCILLYGGSNRKITKDFVDEVLSGFKEGDLILLQNEINELPYIIDRAYDKKMVIVLNPSPYNKAVSQCDLSKVSIFLMNEIEGAQITGKQMPEEVISAMSKNYPKAKVVLTLGEDGVLYGDCVERIRMDAVKVDVVDTTAAGDTFTGYFVRGLLKGLSMKENLGRCVKASAITVSKMGAAESIPTENQVDEIL